ncbi:TPA: ATP-dependent helicase [Burkholderia aenigmatica]|uniref:UvrD-helicase domain-containing protein n=1 Tax=Burkholderia sp. AU45251 TaxID=3059204 RepID=UPI002652CD41|nr:UvrD-helicase domain-containing protein [Burkholderia sp. AU45251]HDR9483240.1 ATP-dependent helicase [Burkholderia aenigmatica]MDN7516105.1 UvrD-helicase domain-containing protein [Burkholderia sp. AU45251]HDR9514188.1 ATP-dependent helicase [Burkholderia aenigmatica]HDR9591578.1 ATP-dependent helicase [Burkholderia aenigmatica]HDR9598670.1 ATP-dependent helicase [Burkholderia aenigmatica]
MYDDLIREEDVTWAAVLMGLGPAGFAAVEGDDSRLRAMLRLDTIDFEACPGSGKTTLLVAKLAVLAMRWPSRQQGICVLSHTNAARNEISAKLSSSAAGVSLTRYPHFVGTIHAFVNEYLALPWLRSKGIEVRCIDTRIAVAKRWSLLPANRRWALQQANLSETCLIYDQTDFGGGMTGRFGPQTPTYQAIIDARRRSSELGYFCFDEMFVWACELLDRHPETIPMLRRRFPLVFIDEAQDNSEAQSALLHRIFCSGDAPSRRQRFGDSNQAIYGSAGQSGATTDQFPGAVVHPMPRSYRFGQNLADQVKGLGVTPHALIGAGPPDHLSADPKASVIFLFDDGSVQKVLERYGQHLLDSFDATVLKSGVFTAVAGVHEPGDDDRIPRAMGHYVPSYDPACVRKESTPNSFAQYLARARFEMAGSGNTDRLINAVAAALLAASELAGAPYGASARKSPHRRVVEMLGDSDARGEYLALQEIILTHQGDITPALCAAAAQAHIEAVLRQLSGAEVLGEDVATFLAPPQAQAVAEAEAAIAARTDNLFAYPPDAPQVHIRLSSIHAVKGETHTATLVLDSFYHAHHLSELKPWLLGTKSGGFSTNARGRQVPEGTRMLGRLRLHYVAMTRPTHLLCLAMRKDAFGRGELDMLMGRGWTVIDCCSDAQVQV